MFRTRSKPVHAVIVSVLISVFVLFAFLWIFVNDSSGQSQGVGWTEPINLSNSGSGSEPYLFVDSEGIMRTIWQDSVVNSFIYTMLQDDGWSAPIIIELPFGTRDYFPDLPEEDPTPLFAPALAASDSGLIHALWRDSENILFHSSVANSEFITFTAWTTPIQIAESVVSTAQATLPDNQVLVAYVQSEDLADAPAGLYYRHSTDNGTTWSEPFPLHLSSYYRLLTTENANVQLVVDNQNRIYIAWDDWANERILFVHSADGDQTWSELFEIDKRQEEDGLEVEGPVRVHLATVNDMVHVIWQAGHEENVCNQYHRWSGDGGNTWQVRQQFLNGLFTCPTEIHFLSDQSNLILLAEESGERYLTNWTENGWIEEEVQQPLSGFQHPDTFQEIDYVCGQDAVLSGEFIWVSSCGQAISQDVWIQQQAILELIRSDDMIPVWEPLTVIETTDGFSSPQLIPDETGPLHMFWGDQIPGNSNSTESESTPISYSRWDNGRWSRKSDVLSIADSPNRDVAVTVDGEGFLLAVWQGGERGNIYFSRASTNDAVLPSEWREPQQLTESTMPSGIPDIAIDSAGTIYVVYTVPINEGRGVYLLKSMDGGETWSEPNVVFDGVEANWEVVEKPRLTISSQDTLHLLWINSSPSFVGVGDMLYYSRSQDGGEEWTNAQKIISGNQQSIQVQGHQIEGTTQSMVHRVWQEWNLGHLSFWHQVSIDDGLTWQAPVQISTVDDLEVPATLAADPAGQIHLLFPRLREGTSENISPYSIEHFLWSGDGWRQMESVEMKTSGIEDIESLTAAVSFDQLIMVIGGLLEEDPQINLFFTQRQLELPSQLSEPEPLTISAPTSVPDPSATPTPLPSPTPTISLSNITNQNQLPFVGELGQFGGIFIGLLVAVAILLPTFFLFRVRQIWIRSKN